MSDFNVNKYWLDRGRTYVKEDHLSAPYYRLQEKLIIAAVRAIAQPVTRIVEIGCGFGRITRILATACPDAQITALDLSPDQLANARDYCSNNHNIEFKQYDIYSGAAIPGAPHDIAVASEVFLHHPATAVSAIAGLLADSCQHLINVDWSEEWKGPLADHVWVHDYGAIYDTLGLEWFGLRIPALIDGKQQKLFVASHDLQIDRRRLEQVANEAAADLKPQDSQASGADERRWTERRTAAITDIKELIQDDDRIIVVDDAQLDLDQALGNKSIPFLESGGEFAGWPADDSIAKNELDRLRNLGADYIAFAWPAFWWFEHYVDFADYLRNQFPSVLQNDRLIVFKLRTAATSNESGGSAIR